MKATTCARCGGPIDRGGAAHTKATICVVCAVAASLADWKPPADAGAVDYDDPQLTWHRPGQTMTARTRRRRREAR